MRTPYWPLPPPLPGVFVTWQASLVLDLVAAIIQDALDALVPVGVVSQIMGRFCFSFSGALLIVCSVLEKAQHL